MKWKQCSKKAAAWGLTAVMCFSVLSASGLLVVGKAAEADPGETELTLSNPVIEAEEGQVVWDCIYFGNYWQSKYITQPGNMPEEGEGDVVHTDDDGTKYIVRADKSCYKYEPIKWRILSVNEDGTDALVMADQTLDRQTFHSNCSETFTRNDVTWENSTVREWLNGTFMDTAFTEEEQAAIQTTEIDNLSYSSYYEEDLGDWAATEDRIYLPSLDDMVNTGYGFINNYNPTGDPTEHGFSETQARQAVATDFAKSGEEGYKAGGYLLRTRGSSEGWILRADGGEIPLDSPFNTTVDDPGQGIRPMFHLDLTRTELWKYAGKVKQDQTEIAPDATPAVPTERPTAQPAVTMAPGQAYPKNPVVDGTDLNKNIWDCIYFGNYYNTKIHPSVLSLSEDDNVILTDEEENRYAARREQGYFSYEPIKWRVLSINEDGTDAFVMADQVIDLAQYYSDNSVEITWEKSDVRQWLNQDFIEIAFTEDEQAAVKTTDVETADNPWSGEAGGNTVQDKVYLPSIEEMLEASYGFSGDANEEATRKITDTDFVEAGGMIKNQHSGFMVYWLRSPGMKKAHPALVGDWGNGVIVNDPDAMMSTVDDNLGVRPVMHVDLSDTALWSYAGQVTPEGVVVPKIKEPEETTEPTQKPQTTQPTQNPNTTVQPTDQAQTVEPKAKKPGKAAIKKLKNSKGKKVTLTLSKKVSGATGYQVAYATKSSMKGQKLKSFKGSSVTVKKLKKKKTYYFRVRAYTKKNGNIVYGSWSSKKSIKIKK